MSRRLLAGVASLAGVLCLGLTLHDARASWPPTAGADLRSSANWPSDPDYAGYWSFFSYLPAQTAGTAPYLGADQKLGASGMSIDAAWERSTGSPSVVIAVIDTGIEWEERDLVNKAWLNSVELKNHKPHHGDGSACGPTAAGPLAGFDCDGDGVLTVNDYGEDPSLTPIVPFDACTNPATGARGPRSQGDVNHNCILDAGDLIALFSDGVDDDSNGYTDDIAGWDFYDDDNDPYDDVRGGHGTTEALESTAEGNNGLEGIGVCPGCRFIMLRSGNSAVVGSSAVAKGVVYATDNQASVVQAAITSTSLSGFARAAIDYAYSKEVVVVASMGDDDSRHHEPATYSHTLAVHGVAYDGKSDTTSTSFVDYVNCTNYGGQLGLSASGAGCSSEATGDTAGIAGLLYSYGLAETPALRLTAEEVMQLQKSTADVIDVPESRASATASAYYESLPGFSQRFGYGRTNAAASLASVGRGLVPPEVEILSPGWFDTLYADRVIGPVPLVGRVVAARATSYDFSVTWAPGVEPLDSDFRALAPTVSNVPGSVVTGGEATPLALIDPSSLDTAHTADPDSTHHENDRTITVRVQATAHYSTGDAHGEARRSIALVNPMNGLDADLLPGFPLALGGSVEAGPKLADINGDGVRDIVLASNDGVLHVFSVRGGPPAEIAHFPYRLRPVDGLDPTSSLATVPSYVTAPAYTAGKNGGIDPAVTRESVVGTPAVGDVFANGQSAIVVVSWEGTVYVVDSEGNDAAGWPVRLPQVPSCPLDPNVPPAPGDCMDAQHDLTRGAAASPVLVALDGAANPLSVVVAAFDGNVYVLNSTGTLRPGFPVRAHSPLAHAYEPIASTPAVGDFNGDGIPDIVVGSDETVGVNGDTGFFYVIDGRGTGAPDGPYLRHWPVEVASTFAAPIFGQGTSASPAIVDLDNDGKLEALLQGTEQTPLVLPSDPGDVTGGVAPSSRLPKRSGGPDGFDSGGEYGALSRATKGDVMLPLLSHPSIGDLDQDGTPDIILSGSGASVVSNLASKKKTPTEHLLGMWSGKTGHMLPASPYVVEDYSAMTSQAVADITGDGYPEVIMGTGGYFVHAVDACGREPAGWPKFTGGWVMATPAVGDINGDHALEVVTATREGFLYAWTTSGTDSGVIAWESFHHDNANTGNYATTLDQGTLEVAAHTLDCALPPVDAGADAALASPKGGGGCSCTIRRGGPDQGRGPVALSLGLLVLLARLVTGRRKRY